MSLTIIRKVTNALVGITESAEYLGVGRITVVRAVAEGELASVRVRRRVLIPREELERAGREGIGTRATPNKAKASEKAEGVSK
jgi:excisionase family DNA binding protein